MLGRLSLQSKLLTCVALLCLIVLMLAVSGFRGVYSYRQLARTISLRARELPLAGELSKSLGDLRVTLSRARQAHEMSLGSPLGGIEVALLRDEYPRQLQVVQEVISRYRKTLKTELPSDPRFGDRSHELAALDTLEQSLAALSASKDDSKWVLDQYEVAKTSESVEEMYDLAGTLPQELHQRMHDFATAVKTEYRTWIIVQWVATVLGGVCLVSLLLLLYVWVVAPLHVLIAGSRRIAQQDDFDHRIYLRSRDEMAELAAALNQMTARFQEIRNDLDSQVKQRTREVVRSEQLASVGFLAAGVAHEINNPLASIAWSAESLEERLHDILHADAEGVSPEQQQEIEVLRKYLRRIQDEAFRCKGITEKLLDFSRLGDVQKHETDLRELVQGVVEMVRHLGKYRQKNIELEAADPVFAPVNGQEIKQVVLNLVTNALDSLDVGGTVWISLKKNAPWAELLVRDDGCGMTGEVLKHLFEPFFTRRRDGSGTGLGLSITYRIVADHGGTIEPTSDGVGKGSRMRVLLPLQSKAIAERKPEKQLLAA